MTNLNSPESNGENNEQEKDDKKEKPKRRKPQDDDKFDWKKATRTLALWIVIIVGSWIIFRQLNIVDQPEVQKSFSQYRRLLDNDQIDSAEIIEREFHGKLKDGGNIITVLPFINQEMLAEWDSLKIDYEFREKTTSWIGYLITSILPWVIIIAIWLYIMRRMQGGGARGVFSFGKSRAKMLTESKRRITFADVAGCDEAKEELGEVIAFLREPKKFSRLGGRIPKGALLLGPPGTGKTLLARAIAGEAEVPFFSMSGADFVEMFVGVGASRVRDLFEQGKKNAPCIIFIDEIDAVGRHRGAGLGGGHDEREQTLNQLLVEMDGFESNEGVILIAATNRPDVLDPALTRPGRFDRQIVVDRPDVRGREGILTVHTRSIPLSTDVNLSVLAKGTPGLAGAELANLVNEAALLAARRNAKKVWMEDFENAKDKVMMGAERRSMLISDDEKRQTAFHEAGHVLVAKLTPGSDPVHKVTIIPRGRALGVTHYLPLDEKHNYSRTYLSRTLIHLLGGRAAERIVFKELSTGAGNDIERASDIARKMVCEWGMSDKLGPVAWGRKNEEVFLGRDFHQQRNYSDRIAQEIDDEIRQIVTNAEKQAEKILRENLDKLTLLAEILLEREILDGEEIDQLLKSGKLGSSHGKGSAARHQGGRARPAKREPERTPPPPPPPQPLKVISSEEVADGKVQINQVMPNDKRPQSRRDFARSFGVVSSRDQQRRPQRQVRSRRTERTVKPTEQQPSASKQPPVEKTPVEEPKKEQTPPVRSRRATQDNRTPRDQQRRGQSSTVRDKLRSVDPKLESTLKETAAAQSPKAEDRKDQPKQPHTSIRKEQSQRTITEKPAESIKFTSQQTDIRLQENAKSPEAVKSEQVIERPKDDRTPRVASSDGHSGSDIKTYRWDIDSTAKPSLVQQGTSKSIQSSWEAVESNDDVKESSSKSESAPVSTQTTSIKSTPESTSPSGGTSRRDATGLFSVGIKGRSPSNESATPTVSVKEDLQADHEPNKVETQQVSITSSIFDQLKTDSNTPAAKPQTENPVSETAVTEERPKDGAGQGNNSPDSGTTDQEKENADR